jgi:hypothetical protein
MTPRIMVWRQNAYKSMIFGAQGDMLKSDTADGVRSTIDFRRAQLYKLSGKFEGALDMTARWLYLTTTTKVVALHLLRFHFGFSANQIRREEA